MRAGNAADALASLALAARLEPANARYGYVYAVALEGSGDRARAIALLESIHAAHPADREVLIALAGYGLAAGDRASAQKYAAKLLALDPRYGSVESLLAQLAAP